MLPSIIEVADKYGLVCNERTRKQKNIRYKCPFCKEDHDRPKKILPFFKSEKTFTGAGGAKLTEAY